MSHLYSGVKFDFGAQVQVQINFLVFLLIFQVQVQGQGQVQTLSGYAGRTDSSAHVAPPRTLSGYPIRRPYPVSHMSHRKYPTADPLGLRASSEQFLLNKYCIEPPPLEEIAAIDP